MPDLSPSLTGLRHVLYFARQSVANFLHNRGMLLSSGVGYNLLLSIVPLFALFCVVMSHFVDEHRLVETIAMQARHVIPVHHEAVVGAVEELLAARDIIGWVVTASLLLFGSVAFRMLQDAIAIIFGQAPVSRRRSAWLTVLMPYVFLFAVGSALLVLVLIVSAAQSISEVAQSQFGYALPLSGSVLMNGVGFLAMVSLFVAIYKIMPEVDIPFRRALVGGAIAGVLWECTLAGINYYFANISTVNAVYGSLATVVAVLVGLEIVSAIVLFGAQVIADLEQNERAGRPWHGQSVS